MVCCLINRRQFHFYVCQSCDKQLFTFSRTSAYEYMGQWQMLPEWYSSTYSTNPTHQVTEATEVHMAARNIYRSSVWNLLHVTVLTNTILRWVLGFWKICGSLTYSLVNLKQTTCHGNLQCDLQLYCYFCTILLFNLELRKKPAWNIQLHTEKCESHRITHMNNNVKRYSRHSVCTH